MGLDKGYAWCAAFVKWSLLKGGETNAKTINGMAASCQRKESLVFYQSKWLTTPLPADVFCLYYKSLGRIGHTGFFDGWANKAMGTYHSVEGNTNDGGSRNGDGVYRRVRQINATHSISRWVL
ncbi:CHAP domain protein [Filimonas lacunae]|nr:CHAP domain protein [Filimonas lacunae]